MRSTIDLGYFTYQKVRNDINWFGSFRSMRAYIYYQWILVCKPTDYCLIDNKMIFLALNILISICL